jgi:hypothetical protein
LYFKKLQADFDSRVVKQSQNKNAKKNLSALVTDFAGYLSTNFGAPKYAQVQALA